MLAESDRKLIIQTAHEYGASQVLLFGSGTRSEQESHDIDIAVAGIPPRQFFQFYGDLMFKLSKPLDVVDLSKINSFTQLIRQEGVLLYERT